MSGIFRLLYFIYKLWVGLVFWLTLAVLYPLFWFLLQKKSRLPAAFRLKRIWSRVFQFLLFCPLRSVFKADLPPAPYIICSNHSAYVDTIFLYSIIPDYFLFIGKGELLKWPLFKIFFKYMDIPIERENFRRAMGAMQKAYDALGRGENVAIYPEGTVPLSSPKMANFKNGAFKMAIDTQLPIVPITWQTNYRILCDPTRLFSVSRPSVVRVVVHEAIITEGMKDEDLVDLRERVFLTIDSALGKH
jgi:1-acyl-sn-glycerol-3-phosphate acyltransferase